MLLVWMQNISMLGGGGGGGGSDRFLCSMGVGH